MGMIFMRPQNWDYDLNDPEVFRKTMLAPVLEELQRRKSLKTPLCNLVIFEFSVQWSEMQLAKLELRQLLQKDSQS